MKKYKNPYFGILAALCVLLVISIMYVWSNRAIQKSIPLTDKQAGSLLLDEQTNSPTTQPADVISENIEAGLKYIFPAGAYTTSAYKYDFNDDGEDEYITYYKQKILLNGNPTEKYYMNVYRYAGNEWIVDHADEGTDGIAYLDEDDFLTFADINNDGKKEVRITKRSDGTGNYRQSYFLVWNGTDISEIFLPNTKDIIEKYNLTSYIKDGESLSGGRFFTPQGNYITICGEDDQCRIRYSNPNASGEIKFDMLRKGNNWKFSNFERINYPKK